MDHSELVEELTQVEKLTPAERIAIARQRRAFQLLKWRERENAAEALLNGAVVDGGAIPVYERKRKINFNPSVMLLEATSRNDLDEVRRLLNNGVDPNSHNEDGLTPLHQCAIDNNQEMLQLLLEHGAEVNARDTELWTPLHAAACCGHSEIASQLINSGALLLAVNADGNMPYDICDDEYTLDLIESEMAKRGITQEDIDEERLSVERRMLQDLQELRDAGGDLEYSEEHGATPLHIACANGYYSCVQFLLDCGCSPDVRDSDGWQPAHAAACWAQADVLELLVTYGADINACTPTNETPLDVCEDEGVRAFILTLQVEAQRRKLLSFGRDSKRMSKRRKPSSKFESPPSATFPGMMENHLAATRGAIRRLSIRDRAGVTLARLEARKEAALLRRYSFEDGYSVAAKQEPAVELSNDSQEEPLASSTDGSFTENCNKRMDYQTSDDVHDGNVDSSSLTVLLVTAGNGTQQSDSGGQTVQSSCQTVETASGKTEANGESNERNLSSPTISTSEWLRKVRQEEERERMPSMKVPNESVSLARKGRRTSPARFPLTPATNGTSSNPQNGQVVSYEREQYVVDSNSGERIRHVRMLETHSSPQQPRTLVPGEPSFSRHPMTLIDLKKQRAEERKLTPNPGRAAISAYSDANSATVSNEVINDGNDVTKTRYQSMSIALENVSSPSTPRSPKLGLRCCRIT